LNDVDDFAGQATAVALVAISSYDAERNRFCAAGWYAEAVTETVRGNHDDQG
jgi:hypothetical protein